MDARPEGRPHLGIDDGCPSPYEMAPSKGLHANQLYFDGISAAGIVTLTGLRLPA